MGSSRDRAISVYPARSIHIEELSDVLTRVFHPTAGVGVVILPFVRAGVREDLKRRMQRSAAQYRCLGAWQNARLIGTVEIGLRRALGGDSDRRYPYIANLAVLPQHRHCGAARQLLTTAENVVRTWGCPQIYLHVMEDNRPARMLYHRLGYRLWRSRRTIWTALGCPRQLLLCKQLDTANARSSEN